jgi:tRNA nucleotidyltransferase (CCA-adding enzyme)
MTPYQNLVNLLTKMRETYPGQADYIRLAGGCVRDAIWHSKEGVPDFEHPSIKDFDIECWGITASDLSGHLVELGAHVDLVGESFGVLKVTYLGNTYDFSLPRRERKTGEGYTGFEVECDPFMTVEEAASRRDLTINAMYYDPFTGIVMDPFDGGSDLDNFVLRPTSARFKEDPLRVLRAFQFAARFDFCTTTELVSYGEELLCEKQALSKERIWVEWEKWCTKSVHPALGIDFLVECGWAEQEITDLKGVEQDPIRHPEGDVYEHTMFVVNAAAYIRSREGLDREDATILMLAALCHDLGKSTTTIFEDGRWKSPAHAEAGVEPTKSFLDKIGCPLKYISPVCTLVKEHMAHLGEPSTRVCRRLVNRLVAGGTSLKMLSLVVEADASGRPPLPKGMPDNMKQLLGIASICEIDGSVPIPKLIQGRDLISLGMKPGPAMGKVLAQLYEMQLDGELTDYPQAIGIAINLIKNI